MTGEREALIAKMADSVRGFEHDWTLEVIAEAMLTAALSSGTAPCPEKCVNGLLPCDEECSGPRPGHPVCPSCNGTGSVDTGPLLVLASRLESTGVQERDGELVILRPHPEGEALQ